MNTIKDLLNKPFYSVVSIIAVTAIFCITLLVFREHLFTTIVSYMYGTYMFIGVVSVVLNQLDSIVEDNLAKDTD